MKNFFLICFIGIALYCSYHYYGKIIPENDLAKSKKAVASNDRLIKQTQLVKNYLSSNSKYNNKLGFFVDMKILSGKHRFFVYDFNQNKVIDQGLVANGSGSETGIYGDLTFSNIPNSNATSLGKYAIGKPYIGRFGKAYKLYGLDDSNSKALERFIVLHKYSQVPYEEQDNPICNSLGCPMVNEKFYSRLEKIIDNSNAQILLTIYY